MLPVVLGGSRRKTSQWKERLLLAKPDNGVWIEQIRLMLIYNAVSCTLLRQD